MRATHVPETGVITVREWPKPQATEPGTFVVRMTAASVCGSDLHAALHGTLHPKGPERAGYPGHEGVGVVSESNSEKFPVGTTVLCVPRVSSVERSRSTCCSTTTTPWLCPRT